MSDEPRHICPVERADGLDTRLRRWLQNPRKILGPYVREGMRVADIGCGPGFLTLDLAELVGAEGCVFAADMQAGMLAKLREKVRGTQLEPRITMHLCPDDRIGLPEPVDLAVAFYVVHEVPDQAAFFLEMYSSLKPDGRLLVIEPPFHVSRKDFAASVQLAREAGFAETKGPRVALSKVAIWARG
ncbi:MAG: methyltransferase domain-containing protein [Candidatus Eisenbacteria bacterium]|nr:methyltransferase domain-containing protein [Candidatus Eisenbacteria bacterium]